MEKKCLYHIIYNGEVKEFFSDRELDEWIYNNREELLAFKNNVSILAENQTEGQKTVAKLARVHNIYSSLASHDKQASDRAHVTALWGCVDPLSPKKLKESYEMIFKRNLKAENPSLSLDEIDAEWKKEEADTSKTEIGTKLHKKLEEHFNGKKVITNPKSEEDRAVLAFADDLQKMFAGKKIHILTEISMGTSKISSQYQPIIKAALEKDGELKLVGTADLIVVTDDGEVHIFDYKTSSHTLGSGWYETDREVIKSRNMYPKTTRNSYEAQVWTYASILNKELGLNCKTHIVKFLRDDNKITGYEGVVDLLENSKIRTNVKHIFDIPTYTKTNTLDSTNSALTSVLGNDIFIAQQAQGFERTADFYINDKKFLRECTDAQKAEGHMYVFKGADGEDVFCDNMTDAKEKVAEFVKVLNEKGKDTLTNLGKNLVNCRDGKELVNILRDINLKKGEAQNAYRILSHYISDGWVLWDEDLLFANGYFIFQKGDRTEMVMMDVARHLGEQVNLAKGTSILGNFLSDNEFGVDNRYYMGATRGNMLLLKAAAFISENRNVFKDKKVSRIIALNPALGDAITTVPASWIAQNWTALCFQNRNIKQLNDMEDMIYNEGDAALLFARDMLSQLDGFTRSDIIERLEEEGEVTAERVEDLIRSLDHYARTNYRDIDNNDYKTVMAELYKALLWLRGHYHIIIEKDVPNWAGAASFAGGFIAPFAISPSANLRSIASIANAFVNKVAFLSQQEAIKWQNMFAEVVKGYKFIGGEYNFFKNWFVLDDNGKVSSEFRLRDPENDLYFKTRPKEAEMCKFFLDTVAKFRWGDRWEAFVGQDEYYEVPLIEASEMEIVETTGGTKGILNVIKRRWERLAEAGTDVFMGSRDDYSNHGVDPNSEVGRKNLDRLWLDNPLRNGVNANRKAVLEDSSKGPGFFEKDLDVVFMNVLVSGIRTNCGKTFMPMFTGYRALMAYENNINNNHMLEIEKAINSYVNSIVLNKSLIPEGLQQLNKLISALRGIVSKIAIGFKFTAGIRELLGNQIKTVSHKLASNPQFSNFNFAEYESSFFEMMVNFRQGFESRSKDYQLTTMFRSANMSLKDMPQRMRSNKYGIKNLDSDFAYLPSMAPDYIHRNAVLKATLKHLGAYNAYIMTDGALVYDWTKDKRWEILFKYASDTNNGKKIAETDYAKITDKNDRSKWKQAMTLYRNSLFEWQKAGENLVVGDPLPEALDPAEQDTFRTQVDTLYGNYDDETKGLMQRTFLGGIFFQFKTFGISQMIQWLKCGGATNITQRHFVYEDGELVWRVWTTEEQQANGMGMTYFKKESELTEEEMERAEPYMEIAGIPSEGRINSCVTALTSVFNPELRKKMWEDPMKRANLFLSLHDSFIMLLLAGLLRLLYGQEAIDSINEQDFWTRWNYAVWMGIAQDGPMWEIARSLWSKGEMPMVAATKRYITSFYSVINGNTNGLYALMNTVGATRELTSFIQD